VNENIALLLDVGSKVVQSSRLLVSIARQREIVCFNLRIILFNRLTPNDPYMGRNTPLTSKRSILYIYSTSIGTEYFKNALHSPFFLFKMQFVS